VGLIIAFTGTVVLMHKDLNTDNGILKGALMGLVASLFYASFYISAQSGRRYLDTLSFLFFSTFAATLVLGLVLMINGYSVKGYDSYTYLHFLALGIGVQVAGWFFVNYAQGYLPATIVAPTLLAQPLLTAVLAILLLKEYLTLWHILGGIVVIAGIYLIHYSKN
jgi:drug/metabolite transporter (DMT)-like permease